MIKTTGAQPAPADGERLSPALPVDIRFDTLVIACGNPMRGDDGVGPVVAHRIEQSLTPSERARHRVFITHQLLPELALELAQARRSILIDARVSDGETPGIVTVRDVTPEPRLGVPDRPARDVSARLLHHWTFPRLLAIAEALYGRVPRASIVSVSAEAFDEGDTLSPAINAVVPQMYNHVRRLLADRCV